MDFSSKCVLAVLLTGCGPKTSAEVAGQALFYNRALAASVAGAGGCLDSWPSEGESTVLPSLDVLCHEGPGKQCRISDTPTQEWEYALAAYDEDPIWRPILARPLFPPEKLYFHHQVTWKKDRDGCTYVVKALGDMDGDGVFSEFRQTIRLAGGELDYLGAESTRRDE